MNFTYLFMTRTKPFSTLISFVLFLRKARGRFSRKTVPTYKLAVFIATRWTTTIVHTIVCNKMASKWWMTRKVYFAVIILCHSDPDVVARVIRIAQDIDMMNGDYAWFIFTDFVTDSVLKPWPTSSLHQGSDFAFRLTAFYAVKMVSLTSVELLICICIYIKLIDLIFIR